MVLSNMRLSTGELFPIPITLDVDKEFSEQVSIGEKIILREKEGFKDCNYGNREYLGARFS